MTPNTNNNISLDLVRQVSEHNAKIANVEKLTQDTNDKLYELLGEFRTLQASITNSTHESRIKTLEDTSRDLVASKNKVLGAVTVGSIFGTILGVIGTWVVEFFRK